MCVILVDSDYHRPHSLGTANSQIRREQENQMTKFIKYSIKKQNGTCWWPLTDQQHKLLILATLDLSRNADQYLQINMNLKFSKLCKYREQLPSLLWFDWERSLLSAFSNRFWNSETLRTFEWNYTGWCFHRFASQKQWWWSERDESHHILVLMGGVVEGQNLWPWNRSRGLYWLRKGNPP